MHMYDKFEGFPLYRRIVWVDFNLMTLGGGFNFFNAHCPSWFICFEVGGSTTN